MKDILNSYKFLKPTKMTVQKTTLASVIDSIYNYTPSRVDIDKILQKYGYGNSEKKLIEIVDELPDNAIIEILETQN